MYMDNTCTHNFVFHFRGSWTPIKKHTDNGLGDSGWEGEGGMKQESSIDIYTLPCMKYIAKGKLLHSRGSSAQCSAMT